MGTRTGDLDPGVSLFLIRNHKLDADSLESLLNHDAGLIAIGGTNDMRRLLSASDRRRSECSTCHRNFLPHHCEDSRIVCRSHGWR